MLWCTAALTQRTSLLKLFPRLSLRCIFLRDAADPRQNRRFVREGDLDKLCRNGVKGRHFWLFNDKLIYGVYSMNGYQLHQDIDLSECEVADAETVQDQDRAFEV